MECPNEFKPELDKKGEFWKRVHAAFLQTFSAIRWNPCKSNCSTQSCKFHAFQAILRGTLADENNLRASEEMKRGLAEAPELYVFGIDATFKYQLTPEETKFLKRLHLEEFVTEISWGLLHSQLATEAILALDTHTMHTTMKGRSIPLIAEGRREQFNEVFYLTLKQISPVEDAWIMVDLFPSVKEATGEAETVHTTDCQYPGAKRPLHFLSPLFCLNPTQKHHITIAFAELKLATLNGQEADWAQELYHELFKEIINTGNTKQPRSRWKEL